MCTPDWPHVVLTLYVSPTAPRRAASTQVRMGTGSSGAVSANVCCDGWLRTNFHFTYCHNGTLPCQFLPPPEGWQHAHAQGGDQNVLLAEELVPTRGIKNQLTITPYLQTSTHLQKEICRLSQKYFGASGNDVSAFRGPDERSVHQLHAKNGVDSLLLPKKQINSQKLSTTIP